MSQWFVRQAIAIVMVSGSASFADDFNISSPNGKVRFNVGVKDGRLVYEVRLKQTPVIERSRVGMIMDGNDWSEGGDLGRVETYQVNEKYPWRGVHSESINHCNGAKILITRKTDKFDYTLEVRSFDDGVAFRCMVAEGEKARVPDEATTFTIPGDSTVWYHDLNGHYEAVHQKKFITDVRAGEWAAPPMTFKLPNGLGYASITEAALINYSGMALQADGNRGFKLMLADKHPPSYPFKLRYTNDVARLSKRAAISDGVAIHTPWRVIIIGRDLNSLVNSDIVPNLCPAPDPALFPNGMTTDWIKPGRAVWKYLDGGPSSFDGMKEFSRLAGELGFEYHVIEGFWSRWSDQQIKELVDYSRERGVGLWLWKHSKDLRTPEAREKFFKRLHDFGVVGAKIDFFDHEHKEIIDLYRALLAEAAKNHIMVNFHGANKPTGEARTWPNELTREAIRGMESSRLKERARHDATLPFTRFLAGPGDYTPVHFGARRADTTWAHQIATAAVFNDPLLTYGAHPTNLLRNPALPMIKSIPAVWDETIVLPESEIGEVAAFARRSGKIWFVAIVNGPEARAMKVPLSFLPTGSFRAMIVSDDETNPASVRMDDKPLSRTDTLTADLKNGGGFIARLQPD